MASGLRSPVSLGFSCDLGVETVKWGGGQVLRGTVDPHIPQGGGRWLRDNAGGWRAGTTSLAGSGADSFFPSGLSRGHLSVS